MSPPSDADFTEFVHASWAGLYRTAYLMLGDRGLAEDLVQTSLAKVYAAWPRVRDPLAAHGYVRRTMANTAASWFRKRSWRNELPTETLPEAAHHPDHSDRPVLMTALAQLPPRQRTVVVLRYFDDLSVAETAEALGITEGTVKSQTFAALARLRTLLGESVVPIGATHD